MKCYEHILRQGSWMLLKPIEAPPSEFESCMDRFIKTLAQQSICYL